MFFIYSRDFRNLALIHGFHLKIFRADSQGMASKPASNRLWRVFRAGLAVVASKPWKRLEPNMRGKGQANFIPFYLGGEA